MPWLRSAISARASGVKIARPLEPAARKRCSIYCAVSLAPSGSRLVRMAMRWRSCERSGRSNVSISCGWPARTIWISFACGGVQILRLVNNQHKTPPVQHLLKQDFIQCAMHGDDVHCLALDAQLAEEITEQLSGITLRLEEEDGSRSFAEIFHQAVEQRRLAHPRFCDEGHE